MIQDLHSHTYYSYCGKDSPEDVIKNAIAEGIDVVGISDHYYGIVINRPGFVYENHEYMMWLHNRALRSYYEHIKCLAEKYKDYIDVRCGIEITCMDLGYTMIPDGVDISYFDYCLIEHVDHRDNSSTGGDLFSFAKRCGCPAGVAHTDMFSFIEAIGEDPLSYFSKMAEENIFWEMNVNLDTIHAGRVHGYMLRFFEDEKQQEIIRKSGVRLSVGFDGHRLYDYKPDRVADYCKKITEMGIKLAFEE